MRKTKTFLIFLIIALSSISFLITNISAFTFTEKFDTTATGQQVNNGVFVSESTIYGATTTGYVYNLGANAYSGTNVYRQYYNLGLGTKAFFNLTISDVVINQISFFVRQEDVGGYVSMSMIKSPNTQLNSAFNFDINTNFNYNGVLMYAGAVDIWYQVVIKIISSVSVNITILSTTGTVLGGANGGLSDIIDNMTSFWFSQTNSDKAIYIDNFNINFGFENENYQKVGQGCITTEEYYDGVTVTSWPFNLNLGIEWMDFHRFDNTTITKIEIVGYYLSDAKYLQSDILDNWILVVNGKWVGYPDNGSYLNNKVEYGYYTAYCLKWEDLEINVNKYDPKTEGYVLFELKCIATLFLSAVGIHTSFEDLSLDGYTKHYWNSGAAGWGDGSYTYGQYVNMEPLFAYYTYNDSGEPGFNEDIIYSDDDNYTYYDSAFITGKCKDYNDAYLTFWKNGEMVNKRKDLSDYTINEEFFCDVTGTVKAVVQRPLGTNVSNVVTFFVNPIVGYHLATYPKTTDLNQIFTVYYNYTESGLTTNGEIYKVIDYEYEKKYKWTKLTDVTANSNGSLTDVLTEEGIYYYLLCKGTDKNVKYTAKHICKKEYDNTIYVTYDSLVQNTNQHFYGEHNFLGQNVYIFLNNDKAIYIGDTSIINQDKIMYEPGNYHARIGVETAQGINYYGGVFFNVTGIPPETPGEGFVLPEMSPMFGYLVAMIICIVTTILPLLIVGGFGLAIDIPPYAYAFTGSVGIGFSVLFGLIPAYILVFILVVALIMLIATYLYNKG